MNSKSTHNSSQSGDVLQSDLLLQTALKNYATAFEKLTPDSLHLELAPLFADRVFFKDPFNQVTGKSAVVAVFEHMFQTLGTPQFTVKHFALAQQTGYLHWEFEFSLPKQTARKNIAGLSQVALNSAGLVEQHIDYWDAAEHVYSKVPLLSWGIRQVAKRLTAT